MASEQSQLRKGCSREGCAPPANTTKGAFPPVASSSEIFEPQKKNLPGVRREELPCRTWLPIQSKANQSNGAPNKQTRSGPFDTCVSVPRAVFENRLPG